MSASTKCVFSFVTSDVLRPDEQPDNSATGVSIDDLKRNEIFVLPVCLRCATACARLFFSLLLTPVDEQSRGSLFNWKASHLA